MQDYRRVAFAGDWHANTPWATRMIEYSKALGAEAIFHLGDFGWNYSRPYVAEIQRSLRATGQKLFFVDGNHEDFTRLHAFPLAADGTRQLTPNLFHLPRGHRFTLDGIDVLCCGGAVSVDRHRRVAGQSWWPQEQITAQDIAACESGGRAHLLLAHDCPSGVEIPHLDKSGAFFPAAAIRESQAHRAKLLAIAFASRVSVIFHGHYHRAYQARPNLGWGPVRVQGLDCDASTGQDNVAVYDTAQIRDWAGLPEGPGANPEAGDLAAAG